jgi:hypothetical protein
MVPPAFRAFLSAVEKSLGNNVDNDSDLFKKCLKGRWLL